MIDYGDVSGPDAQRAFENDPEEGWFYDEPQPPPPEATKGQKARAARHKAENEKFIERAKTDEHHEPQFTGAWLPADIMRMLWAHKLTAKEVILLATIDALTKNSPGGRGCFASNEYLGKMVDLSASRVSRTITRFKRMNLVKQVSFDGRRRTLETRWSRVVRRGPPNKL